MFETGRAVLRCAELDCGFGVCLVGSGAADELDRIALELAELDAVIDRVAPALASVVPCGDEVQAVSSAASSASKPTTAPTRAAQRDRTGTTRPLCHASP